MTQFGNLSVYERFALTDYVEMYCLIYKLSNQCCKGYFTGRLQIKIKFMENPFVRVLFNLLDS